MEEIERYIITEKSVYIQDKIKKFAGESLRSYLITMLFISFIIGWVPEILSLIFPMNLKDLMLPYLNGVSQKDLEFLRTYPVLTIVWELLFSGVFSLGQALFSLTYIRNKEIDFNAFGEGFKFYFKAFALGFIQSLIIGIGLILFIVPGIIFALNFSQIYFILADEPKMGIFEILSKSKSIMKGNRIKFISFCFSYLLYIVFAAIPAFFIIYILEIDSKNFSGLTGIGFNFILYMPIIIACSYLYLGTTVFYELLINKGFENFKYRKQEVFREKEIDANNKF